MNRIIDNKIASYGRTLITMDANPEILTDMPDMADDVLLFRKVVADLKEEAKKYELAMAGKSKEKAKSESNLLDALQPVTAKLKSYASKQGGEALKELANTSPTAMQKMRDPEFLRFAENVIETVKTHAEELKGTGLKQAGIDRLSAAATAFAEKTSDRDDSQNTKTGIGKNMFDLVAKIDLLLTKTIDPLVESVYEEYPAFYTSYFSTRTVHDHGVRHRKPVEPPAPPTPPATDAQS